MLFVFTSCQAEVEGAEPSATNVRTISRRDANAFVRGVRRYGQPSRMSDIAAEVGPALQEAPAPHQMSLWHSLVDGCKKAVAMTAEDAKVLRANADDQGVRHVLCCIWQCCCAV